MTWADVCRRHRAAVPALVAGTLLAVATLPAAPALAQPTRRSSTTGSSTSAVQTIEQQLMDAQGRAEILSQRIDKVKVSITKLEGQRVGIAAVVNGFSGRLAAAQRAVEATVRATYISTGGFQVAELYGLPGVGGVTGDVENQLTTAGIMLTRLKADRATVAAASTQLTRSKQQQAALESRLTAERTSLVQAQATLNAMVASIPPELQAQISASTLADDATGRAIVNRLIHAIATNHGLHASPIAVRAIAFAFAQLGKPYLLGAAGPAAFDCSGLTMAAYASVGIRLPHHAADQFWYGTAVARNALLPGDLVFYAYNPADPTTVHHVAMYIGDGYIVQAPHTGAVVSVSPMFSQGYAGAVRLVSATTANVAIPPIPPIRPHPTAKPTPSPSPTTKPTPKPTPTPTPTRKPTVSPTPSHSPTASPTKSPTPSASGSASPTKTPSKTPSRSSSARATPSAAVEPGRFAG